jgi:methyl-accepting chemotaxis protein
MTGQMMQFNETTVHTSKILDNISSSLFNTVKYTAFNAILNSISGTIQHAYSYVKELDSSLNDIRIVTGKSADEMERFAEQANDAAKNLDVTTSQYTEGSLIYYQQGLDDDTVKALTDITAKTSNVTQQSMSTVSEQLTAV